MKRSVISYLLGKILYVEALLLMFPTLVAVIYQESLQQVLSYLSVSVGLFVFSLVMTFKKPEGFKLYLREGMVVVALGWILLSFFGALPFVLSGEIPNFVDAFFETASGFTTTGSSILSSISHLQHSSLFWRNFTQLVGGMGVLVFTLAVLPNSSEYVQLMRAEVPGPVFGKIVSRVSGTARILYGIYLAITFLLILILLAVKVPLFDAVLLSFGTAGTGGFAISDAGFSIYENQAAVEWIIGIGMLIFGINFNVYYLMILGYIKDVLKNDEELKFYLGVVVLFVAAISLNIMNTYQHVEPLIRHVFFTVSSIVTTTGFSTANFDSWPTFSKILLLGLMFMGGCAGSTAGGIKVSRVLIYLKEAIAEIKRSANKGRVVVPKLSGKPITKSLQQQVAYYLLVYILMFSLILVTISLETHDFETTFSTVATTFNNVGPGFAQVGPQTNFGFYSNASKILLSFTMIAGRLEIYPMIILFSPNTIKKLLKID